MRFKRLVGLLLVILVMLGTTLVASSAAGAFTTPPKVAMFFGDSLTYEASVNSFDCWFDPVCHTTTIDDAFYGKNWTVQIFAMGGLAVCDYVVGLPGSLATNHPSVVVMEAAGNSVTDCMRDDPIAQPTHHYVVGTQAYYDKYRADLTQFAVAVLNSGAKIVLVKPPPSAFTGYGIVFNNVETALGQIMTEVALAVPGISVTAGPRNAVSNAGKYVSTKPCLTTETAAMGCNLATGKIAVRAPDTIHFCPTGFAVYGCSVYSSGASRFAKALKLAAISPPQPLVPIGP